MTETNETTDIDPVTLEVLWSRLRGIPRDMGIHFHRTAFSSVIKNAKDYSTAIFSTDGRLLAQGVRAPGHLGTMPFMVKKILKNHFSLEEWDEGDVVATNDPYINSGHLPDIFMFKPIFYDGDIAAFSVVGGHHLDIGGPGPASYSMFASDMYAEGLQIPPLKMYKKGELNRDILKLIMENSREPKKIRGDLRAQYGALLSGEELYLDILDDYSFDTVEQYNNIILEKSEDRIRKSITELPDGSYSHTEYMDGYDEELPICTEVTIDEDEIFVDYTGTADQQQGFAINTVEQYTFSYSMLALKALLDPETPQTEGTVNPIHVSAPEGSLLNPNPPVPVSCRQLTADYIISTIRGALNEAIPEENPAPGGQQLRHMFKFTDEETGEMDVLFDGHYGGAGACPDRDGYPAVSGSTNLTNTPVEYIEGEYPLRIDRYELVPDTGGAGKYSGGNSTLREYVFLSDANVQLVNERFKTGPFGVNGGGSGSSGKAVLQTTAGKARELSSKENFDPNEGDVLKIRSTGGGGYGEPEARDEDQVIKGVSNELITSQTAREVYNISSEER